MKRHAKNVKKDICDGLYRTYHLYGSGEGFKAPRTRKEKKG
jgi:hypothetical protein